MVIDKLLKMVPKACLYLGVKILLVATSQVLAQDETGVNFENKLDSLQRTLVSLKDKERVDSLLSIGRLLVVENKYEYAFALFERTLDLSEEYGYQIGKGLSYAGIGSIYKERQDDPEACKRNYLEALAIGERTEDPEVLARAHLGIGAFYGLTGNYDSAYNFYEKGEVWIEASENRTLLSQLYLRKGDIHAIKGNYTDALPAYLKALKTAKEFGDNELIAVILNSMGIVYYQTGQKEQAIDSWQQSVSIFKMLGQEGRLGGILVNMGTAFRDQKQYQMALEAYQESLEIAESFGNKISIIYALICLGDLYTDLEEHNKAKRYYEQSLTLTDETKQNYLRVYTLTGLGKNHFHLNEYRQARDYFHDCINLANEMELLVEQRDGYLLLSALDSAMGYYDSAYIHYKQHATLSQTILDDEKVKQLAEMRAKYEAEEQEAKNERLQLINQWQNRRINYLIVGSIVSMLMLVFILALYLKLKKAHNKNRETLQLVEHQKEALAESNATKEQFFSIIAHDLKSPLNSLQGLISVATERHGDRTNEYVQYFNAINDDIKSITYLLNNLLYWSLNQKNQITFQPERLNLTALIRENLKLVASLINRKEIEVIEKLDGEVHIHSDKNMISFILRNLLTNAAKFTQVKGQIVITLSKANDSVSLSIQDNGMGMKKEEIDSLFSKNKRFTKQGTFKERGTGLGLQLCSEFAEKMGVVIDVQSEQNVGTAFQLVFPVRPQSTLVEQEMPADV